MFDQIGATASGLLGGAWNNYKKAIDFSGSIPGVSQPMGPVAKPNYPVNAAGDSIALRDGKPVSQTTPGLLHQTPSTPVKSVTTSDGTKTEYHAPVKTSPEVSPEGNTGISFGPSSGISTSSPPSNPTPIQDKTPSPSTYNQATAGLLNIGNNGGDAYNAAINNLKVIQDNKAKSLAGNAGTPMTAGNLQGSEGILNTQYNSQIANAQAQVANTLQGQGQQITALNDASGLTKPEGNTAYFGSPETGGMVGVSQGGAFPGATGNSLIDTTVQQALSQVYAGGDPTNNPGFDAVKALNSPQAVNAYNQGVAAIKGGTYNPTASSASAQTNAAQRAQFQQQSKELGVALEGLSKVGNLADNFLQTTGLNPNTSAFVNAQQNTTLGQLKNPSNIATYNELVNQVQTYAGQIFASTGMTPTAADGMAKNISIDGMPVNALKAFLKNLDIIGQTRKSALDKGATTDYAPGSTSIGKLETTPSSNQYYEGDNATLEAIGGGLTNFAGDAAALGGSILKFLHL